MADARERGNYKCTNAICKRQKKCLLEYAILNAVNLADLESQMKNYKDACPFTGDLFDEFQRQKNIFENQEDS